MSCNDVCISCGSELPPLDGSEENDFRFECDFCRASQDDDGFECKHEEAYSRHTYVGGEWKGTVSYCRECGWSESKKPEEAGVSMAKCEACGLLYDTGKRHKCPLDR